MLNENFVFLGAIVSFIGSYSYFKETVKGRIQPNRVTWVLWSLIPLIAFAAEIKQGVGIQSLTTFIAGFLPLLIFLGSFVNKKAYWKLGRLDITCGILSVLGLILWSLTRVGDIAIIFSILADGLAALPTIIKSYKHPESENYLTYLAGFIAAAITILTIKDWNLSQFGFPLYILIIDAILVVAIKFKIKKQTEY